MSIKRQAKKVSSFLLSVLIRPGLELFYAIKDSAGNAALALLVLSCVLMVSVLLVPIMLTNLGYTNLARPAAIVLLIWALVMLGCSVVATLRHNH